MTRSTRSMPEYFEGLSSSLKAFAELAFLGLFAGENRRLTFLKEHLEEVNIKPFQGNSHGHKLSLPIEIIRFVCQATNVKSGNFALAPIGEKGLSGSPFEVKILTQKLFPILTLGGLN